MRTAKTTFLAILMALTSQFVWAQDHEAQFLNNNDLLKSVKIYPNPATDYLVIRFEGPIARTITIKLHTIIGNQLEPETEVVDEYEIHLRVKDLPTGYYLLAMQDEGHQRNTLKFMKR